MTELKTKPTPKSSLAEKELDRLENQFNEFDSNIKKMNLDRMNMNAKREEEEPQTKLSQSQIEKSKDIYIKPKRTISCKEKFNEKFRESYEFDKEYVHFIAENKEIIGESLDLWTKPYAGVPAENWEVPVNKPVWGPRYLAEQIKRKYYHRLIMQQNSITGSDGMGQYYGALAADTTIQRLDAHPVSDKKSVFMGANSF